MLDFFYVINKKFLSTVSAAFGQVICGKFILFDSAKYFVKLHEIEGADLLT